MPLAGSLNRLTYAHFLSYRALHSMTQMNSNHCVLFGLLRRVCPLLNQVHATGNKELWIYRNSKHVCTDKWIHLVCLLTQLACYTQCELDSL